MPKTLRLLCDDCTNPYWNLAAEEYLFTHAQGPVCRLWRNRPSIIVGLHQNTAAEVNAAYVAAHQIDVVRRITGGGAVYHDLGNVNYTIVDTSTRMPSPAALFRIFTTPVIRFLHTLGVEAQLVGRNDLQIDGRKFSGTAIAVRKDHLILHGTFLFDSQLEAVGKALTPKVRVGSYSSKAVASNPKRVANVKEYLDRHHGALEGGTPTPQTAVDLIARARDFLLSEWGMDVVQSDFSPQEREAIDALCQSRYSTYEWNYGASPTYNFHHKARFEGGNVEVFLTIGHGCITQARIYGDYFFTQPTETVEAALVGCPHVKDAVRARLAPLDLSRYFTRISLEEITALLTGEA